MAKKDKTSMEAGLWAACNKLRGSIAATDYVNVVLGLLFLRFAHDKFVVQRDKLLANEDTKDFVDNPRFYTKDNVFYLEENDRWSYIKDNSKSNKIFVYIDDAFRNLEKNNISLKGALPIGFYTTLHKGNRGTAPRHYGYPYAARSRRANRYERDEAFGDRYKKCLQA